MPTRTRTTPATRVRRSTAARAGAPALRTSDDAVRTATGRARDAWFALLDKWGAAARTHGETAAWLMREHGVDNWWSQSLTVDYEYARGLRAPGRSRDGTYTATATKTIAAPVARVFKAFTDARQRRRWLSDGTLRTRTSQPNRSARFDWDDGTTRLIVDFVAKGEGKTQVALLHERLPDAKSAETLRAYWRERLTDLAALLTD